MPPTKSVKSPEFINEPGDVITELLVITTASGKKHDVSNFVMGLHLYEDVFSNIMFGEATFVDSADLVSKLALQGNEFLTLSYRTPSFKESISKSFYISGIKDRFFSANERQQIYTLTFMSIEGLKDNNTVISKKYTGTSETIVNKIYSEYLSTERLLGAGGSTSLSIGGSLSSNTTFVVPSWSPLRTINWVANRSFETPTSSPSFLFFETNKGFYFASIEQLIKSQVDSKDIFAEYIYFPGAATIQFDTKSKYSYTKPEIGKQYNIVRTIKPFKTLDIIDGQDFGYFSSRLFTVDMTLKQQKDFPFNYYEKHKQFRNLEKYQPFGPEVSKSPDNLRSVRTKQFKVHDDAGDPQFEKWVQERNSIIYEVSNIHIEIEVPGRTDIEVGKIVNFLYPKSTEKLEGDVPELALDPYLSGLYIITAIHHQFSLNKHTMFIELSKDSYSSSLSK